MIAYHGDYAGLTVERIMVGHEFAAMEVKKFMAALGLVNANCSKLINGMKDMLNFILTEVINSAKLEEIRRVFVTGIQIVGELLSYDMFYI